MYVICQERCCVDVKVHNGKMVKNICYPFGNVAYFFGEFANDFIKNPDVIFG